MLVLTRRNNESVVIGGAGGFDRLLRITVLRVKGGNVRLGFEVADDIPIHRAEVWERICADSDSRFPQAGNVTPAA